MERPASRPTATRDRAVTLALAHGTHPPFPSPATGFLVRAMVGNMIRRVALLKLYPQMPGIRLDDGMSHVGSHTTFTAFNCPKN